MHDYRQLDVYEDARRLVRSLYEHTSSFPRAELFGLTQQIRRSAISVASNIAEGAGRDTNPDFAKVPEHLDRLSVRAPVPAHLELRSWLYRE